MDTLYNIMADCPLFKGLKPDEIESMLGSVNYQVKKYKKDSIIALSGDECRNLLIVAKGSVKGEMIDFTGKIIKIEDIESPRPLAPAFLFGKNNHYPVTIVANEDVNLLLLPKSSVLQMLQNSNVFLNNFLNQLSNRAQFLSNKLKFLSFQTIKDKIAHYILQLARQGQKEITLVKSQNDLAELFGVTRPSLGRAIRELDKDGYIKATGKNIEILNPSGLSMLLR